MVMGNWRRVRRGDWCWLELEVRVEGPTGRKKLQTGKQILRASGLLSAGQTRQVEFALKWGRGTLKA